MSARSPIDALLVAALQHAHDARLAESAMHGQSPAFEIFSDQFRRADLLVAKFGMRMDRSSERLDFFVCCFDFWNQVH